MPSPALPQAEAAPRVSATQAPGRLRGSISNRRQAHVLVAMLPLFLLPLACTPKTPQRVVSTPDRVATLDRRSPFLKVHLRDGGVCVLGRWQFVVAESLMIGEGNRYDAVRTLISSGSIRVPLDSVALFETNTLVGSTTIGGLTAMTVLTGLVAALCASNPKACFGSCPTFYLDDGGRGRLLAEGFSSSIAPALEATDLDALYRAAPTNRDLVVRVTNEALETHVIRHADILAAPRPPDGRVLATPAGLFLEARTLTPPSACLGPEGNILDLVRAFDGVERCSTSDSTDLAARETIELELTPPRPAATGVPHPRTGLVIAARQSLLTTFLFYQELAWLGNSAVATLAALDRSGEAGRRLAGGVGTALGGIEVQVPDGAGGFRTVGEVRETGPLAADLKVVPLPPGEDPVRRVRLRLTRGHWRLDFLALAELGAPIRPIRLRPTRVERNDHAAPEDLAALHDSTRTLVTLPGDALRLHYRLPADPAGLELFLESRGYYLEWLRQAWLAEEDHALAARLFLDPEGALRDLAPEFKRREAGLDSTFWRSRYARP